MKFNCTKVFIYIVACLSLVTAQREFTWQWTGRVHSELDWHTLETKHFNIHYHDGIEELAKQGASISEQVLPTLLKQMDLDTIPKIDLTFTSADEIMNGFAMWTNMSFIWVDQNDAAIWLEDEKWLFQVIAHELQHIVLFNVIKTWLPEPINYFFSGVPGWFVEGSAEYYTEKWRPYRGDLYHKIHVLKNKVTEMRDPHMDGYSKLLYMADRFGDSTIVKIVNHRNKLKLLKFEKSFKEHTGIELSQFEEDWRRHMNTYFYSYRSQKEAIEEIGEVATLPINKLVNFAFSPDSLKIAMVGRDDKDQWDISLIIAEQDTTKAEDDEPKSNWLSNLFSSKKDTVEEKKKPKPRYNKKEMDHGWIHPILSWSSDGTKLVYSKYHFGKHQSLEWDIRVVDVEMEKGVWLTHSLRAAHPNWSPVEDLIVFIAHKNSSSNLYTIKPDGTDLNKLTDYSDDTQIVSPAWSPDGNMIAFAEAGPDGNMDIMVLEIATNTISRLTDFPDVDYLPVWHPDGKKITFTSHKGITPNLHTIDLETKEVVRNTDVGDAVWGVQWAPKGNSILSRTLTDVDTVRIVEVDANRTSTTSDLNIRNYFSSWRTKAPDILLASVDPHEPVEIMNQSRYRFLKHIKHMSSFLIPMGNEFFGYSFWADGLGRHILGGYLYSKWNFDNPSYLIEYVNAQHGPLWGVNYYERFNFSVRQYDENDLIEQFDGWEIWTQVPINFGNHLSSNHSFKVSANFWEREATYTSENGVSVFPEPESGKESIFSFAYQWVNRRPHKSLFFIPNNGTGILFKTDISQNKWYGDFSYKRFTFDSFTNQPFGPFVFYLRGKAVALSGAPPAQELVGLTHDFSYYLPGTAGTGGQPENLNPRGWSNGEPVRLGDRVVFGTAELRLPLFPQLPLNALGFTLGSLSGALISDVGNAWSSGEKLGDWIVTAGYELKVAFQLGSAQLFLFSYGEAQTVDEWKEDEKPREYFRLAMINPF